MVEDSIKSLDQRRLELEESKARWDHELRLRELEFKRVEGGFFARFTPLTTTLAAGVLTIAGSAFATFEQSRSTIGLETQKEQHELIVKMISVGDEKQARSNLRFLAEAKLVDKELAASFLSLKEIGVLPTRSLDTPPFYRAIQSIKNDDDALDLAIYFEGGFEPNGPSMAGITLATLSRYLGKGASIEDLKGLTNATIKDIYRKAVGDAVKTVKSPEIRAVYYNWAILMGRSSADRIFRAAAEKILGHDVDASSELSDVLNGIADADLLAEAANCAALAQLKAQANVTRFMNAYINRARAFSPSILKGLCVDLQPSPRAAGSVP